MTHSDFKLIPFISTNVNLVIHGNVQFSILSIGTVERFFYDHLVLEKILI